MNTTDYQSYFLSMYGINFMIAALHTDLYANIPKK